jgi:hypothetical protein
MSESEKKKLKFDEPIPTKSGELVIVLWRELQECISEYKRNNLIDDKESILIKAKRIRAIQDDLGITVEKFPHLGLM